MKYIITAIACLMLTNCAASLSFSNLPHGMCETEKCGTEDRVSYGVAALADSMIAAGTLGIGNFSENTEARVIVGSAFIISAGIGIVQAIFCEPEDQ